MNSFLHQASFATGYWYYDRHRSVRLVILVGLAIDQIAQSGLSSLSVIYYSAQLFREDLDNFIGNDIFHVENAEDFMTFADSAIKKKVSLIISSGILNDQPIENLIECAQKIGYQLGITNVNGDNKITMPNSKREVKQLLYFLDQGYFNSIITNELMLTNSKRPIRI
ncbi:hypothetical protein [Citrobacter sp. RHBSTW-00089]|uniref:hypothetical protein n=1 Tax=Citrobacter sp. RHBSTW-00089 TaxID=2742633 RepID=UPI002E165879